MNQTGTGFGVPDSSTFSGALTSTEKVQACVTGTYTEQQLLDAVVAASAAIETYCQRQFNLHAVTEVIEICGNRFVLSDYPVVSVDSITDEDDNEIAPRLVKDNGVVVLHHSANGFLTAAYTAGYQSVPKDLELIATELASAVLEKKLSPGMKSESIGGDYSYIKDDKITSYVEAFYTRLAPHRVVHL